MNDRPPRTQADIYNACHSAWRARLRAMVASAERAAQFSRERADSAVQSSNSALQSVTP
jgi:hypothetical protein